MQNEKSNNEIGSLFLPLLSEKTIVFRITGRFLWAFKIVSSTKHPSPSNFQKEITRSSPGNIFCSPVESRPKVNLSEKTNSPEFNTEPF